MAGVLTAEGQLAIASEFRFDIRHDGVWREYITVKRGRGPLQDKWAIAANESEYGRFFDSATGCWTFAMRGGDPYVWDLEPALVKAQELAAVAQKEITEIMERRETRGGEAAASD